MEIRRMENVKFGTKKDYVVIDRQFALYEPGKGYVSMADNVVYGNIRIPYSPQGGKKALQKIIDAGGFCDMNNVTFVNPI